MPITIRKGSRKQHRLRMLIDGPTKVGKSPTALRFANALAPNGRVLVIEAGEGGATELYFGDEFDGRISTREPNHRRTNHGNHDPQRFAQTIPPPHAD
jgi:hypothetical protein